MVENQFESVAIIGLGLIGGSIAKTIRRKNIAKKIIGCNHSDATIKKALSDGAIDYGTTSVTEAIEKSELAIICTPISTFPKIFEEINKSSNKNCLITDAASVKSAIIKMAEENIKDKNILENFIPAHPIAGSENSGFDASTDNLFDNKNLIITKAKFNKKSSYKKVADFWHELGMNVIELSPKKHDKIYACVSHLPQLLAFAYKKTSPQALPGNVICKKFTRLTNSSADLWKDIFNYNDEAIKNILNKFINQFDTYAQNPDKIKKEKLQKLRNKSLNDFPDSGLSPAFPIIIAASLIKITKKEYFRFAGSGFRDFTSIINANIDREIDKIEIQNFMEKLNDLKY